MKPKNSTRQRPPDLLRVVVAMLDLCNRHIRNECGHFRPLFLECRHLCAKTRQPSRRTTEPPPIIHSPGSNSRHLHHAFTSEPRALQTERNCKRPLQLRLQAKSFQVRSPIVTSGYVFRPSTACANLFARGETVATSQGVTRCTRQAAQAQIRLPRKHSVPSLPMPWTDFLHRSCSSIP